MRRAAGPKARGEARIVAGSKLGQSRVTAALLTRSGGAWSTAALLVAKGKSTAETLKPYLTKKL